MKAAGGRPMDESSSDLQYLIREHMIENSPNKDEIRNLDNGMLEKNQNLHLRWNSQKGKVCSLFCAANAAFSKYRYLFLLVCIHFVPPSLISMLRQSYM